ncbi:DUF5681 domain-containing protein [Undibacterium sp. Xuan67W]|uniref:DUF5681 domain-containing protein n=1 Tax=Undibacterium sp. Xuan67W TaxID=3413057 RepID=UPI003BEF9FB8
MDKKPHNRFMPGQSGNPKGRMPGVGKVGKLRAAIEKHVPSIIETLVVMAKNGDSQAARLLLERVLPPVRAIEQAVALQLPEGGTLTAKADAVLSAASNGTLAPSQAAQLLAALGTLSKIVEVDSLADRIAVLELLTVEGKNNE